MKSAWAVVKFLTIIGRLATVGDNPQEVGRGALYFPLLGLVLGLVLALLDRLLEANLDAGLLSTALVAVLIIMTGAKHMEGLQSTFDAFHKKNKGHGSAQRYGETFGWLAIVIVFAFKVRSIDIIGDKIYSSLLLTPAFARWALVVFLYGATSVAEGEARQIAENVKFWHLAVVSIVILGLAYYLLGRIGLWIGLSVSVFALLLRAVLQRCNGALTLDNFGALIELTETLSLMLLATL